MTSSLRNARGTLRLWLGLALVASIVLAFQSVRQWQSHRRTAESVLSDYARLAAWELKTRLEFRFAVYTCGAIARSTTVLDRLETDEPLPTPDALAALMPPSQRPAFDHLREIHVFEFAPERFRGAPPENADALAALVRRETAQGTDEERGWFYSHAEGTGRRRGVRGRLHDRAR
jgi:hypothetical protein